MRDPDLAVTLPPSWYAIPEATVRSQLEQASSTMTGPLKAQMDQKLADIDAGSFRLFVAGPSGFDPWEASVGIEVFDNGSATTRIDTIESMTKVFAPVTNLDRRNVTLLIGTAIRLSMTAGVPKDFEQTAIPAHGIAYAVELDDGRTLLIDASGPDASATFADMIDTMVSTIRPR